MVVQRPRARAGVRTCPLSPAFLPHPACPGGAAPPHAGSRSQGQWSRGSHVLGACQQLCLGTVQLAPSPSMSCLPVEAHSKHKKGSDLPSQGSTLLNTTFLCVGETIHPSFGFSQWLNPITYNLRKSPYVHFSVTWI